MTKSEKTLPRREWFQLATAAITATAAAVPALAAPTRLPQKVRLAVIGQDGHLGDILNPLPQLPDVEVVGFSEATPEALARLSKNKALTNAKGFLDYRQMLDQTKPDVVAVTNDDGARAAAVLEAVNRGLHTIAEKPLAIKRQDLDKIKAAVAKSKGKFSMLTPLRFAPPFLAMKQVIDSGEIGEVLLLGGQKSYKRGANSAWKNRRASYGSTMLWIGPHLIDLFHFAGGRKMTDAFCWQTNVQDPTIGDRENVVGAIFKLDNGGIAEMRMDYLRPDSAPTHEDDRLRVAGTKGIVEYTAATGVTVINNSTGPRKIETLPPKQEIFVDFLESIYNNKKPHLTLEEVFHVSQVIQAAEDSSRLNRVVKV
jgi:predicted dehydrogenase